MRVRVGCRTYEGTALDLRDAAVSADALAAAIADPDDERVRCPPPGPAYEHVGVIDPELSLSLPAAVAAAARSTGATAPQDEALAAVRAELDSLTVPPVDLADARRAVAEARRDEAALREQVARLGGRVEARRAVDAGTDAVEADLRDAARRLSEAETERLATEQTLDRATAAARDARDARERRLELRDRADNLRRAARATRAARHYDAFAEAVRAVPGDAAPGAGPTEFEGDDVTAALGVARLADLDAPVVLACERFAGPAAASACLGASVVLV